MAATLPYPNAVERFPILRQSVLAEFDNCPLTSAFSLAHDAGWSGEDAARGQISHRVVAKALQRMVVHEQPDRHGFVRVPVDVVVDEILPDVLAQHDVPHDSPDGLGEDVQPIPLRQVAQVRISLKAWANNCKFTKANIAAIEKRLGTVVTYPNRETGEAVQRTVTGKLDLLLIDGLHATVCDWKDTFAIPPESRISEEGFFQQRLYALQVFDNFPRIQRVTLREFYLRYASGLVQRNGRLVNPVREATIDRYNVEEIRGEMSALVERFDRSVELGRYKAQPGSHCSYCARPMDCPILPKARRAGRITSREEAEQVAGELNVAEAAAAHARKALRSWSRLHGDVRVKDAKRDRVFGEVIRTRTVKPSLEEVRAATLDGRPVDDLYVAEEHPWMGVHTPDELHPYAAAVREEEEMLLAAERREGGGT